MQEIRVQGLSTELAAKAWGDPKKKPVLAIHGWLDNAATFDGLGPLLSDIYLVAVDFPGHGQSPWREGALPYHFVDWVPEVFAIAKNLGWKQFSILGHSMGAGIATLFASAAPEKIDRLVLLDGLSPLTSEAYEAPARLRSSLGLFCSQDLRRQRTFENLDKAYEVRSKVGGLALEAAKPIVDRGTVKTRDGFQWSSDPRLTLPSLVRLTPEQTAAFLSSVQAETLVIQAENGLIPKNPTFLEQLELLKNARIEVVQGGHHVHLEAPNVVADLVRPFLSLVIQPEAQDS